MKRIEKIHDRFCALFLEGRAGNDFPALCRRLHVCPDDLDDILVQELGLCGQDLLLLQGKPPFSEELTL